MPTPANKKEPAPTPTPWEVIHEAPDACFIEASWAPLPGHEIVPRGPLAEANAAFIVEAVNSHARLVAALEELLIDAEAYIPDQPVGGHVHRHILAARAALPKPEETNL